MSNLPSHETLEIEFKRDRPQPLSRDEILETVVGFANTRGGTLYLGIEDDGTVSGANDSHMDLVALEATIADNTIPSVPVRATLVAENPAVVAVDVPWMKATVATRKGRLLKRRIKADGTPETCPLYPAEISTQLSDLGQMDLSLREVVGATPDDFDPEGLRILREIIRASDISDGTLTSLGDEELWLALRLALRKDEGLVPTLAGMLLLGKEESLCRYVRTHEFSFQVREGTSLRDNWTTHKALLGLVFYDIPRRFMPWNHTSEFIDGMRHVDVPDFDPLSFREVIVNAFCHRDYSMVGGVRVEIDDTGYSVSSSGGFIPGISQANLLTAEPVGRNPALADTFKRIGLAERTGRGIDRIFLGQLRYGRRLPDYSESTDHMVRVFISRGAPDEDFVRLAIAASDEGHPLSLQEALVLWELWRHRPFGSEGITLDELMDTVDMSRTRLEETLDVLADHHLIIGEVGNRNRRYLVNGAYLARLGISAHSYARRGDARDDREQRVLALARRLGAVSARDVAEYLGISHGQAYYLLRSLMEKGSIRQEGKARSTVYIPV